MEEYQSIGKRIAALRKVRGMTQDQLAERVGVSPQAVSKWENDNSCPDISIVPRVAEVLGVSTDELLGVKPIEPQVVVQPDNGQKNDSAAGCANTGHDRSGLWFGILIVLLGVTFLLARTNIWPFGAVNFWGIVWPAVMLGLGVSWLVKHASPIALGVAVLGLYYLLYNLGAITYVLTWSMIWPILLILVGLSILLDRLVPGFRRKREQEWQHGCGDHTPTLEYSDEGGYVHFESAFTETRQIVDPEVFTGGRVETSFGKTVLDMTQCKSFAPGAVLQVEVSFGTCEVFLPRTVQLQQNVDRAFASADVRGVPYADAPYTLTVRGETSFGSLVLRYE